MTPQVIDAEHPDRHGVHMLGLENRSTLLRRALMANAAFSSACVLAFAFAGHLLAPAMGLPESWGPWALYAVAGGLAVFAGGVWLNARRPVPKAGEALATTLADLGWVLGTVVLLAVWGGALTGFGVALSVGVALAVGTCALGQAAGLRRLVRNPEAGNSDAPRSRMSFGRDIAVDPAQAWAVISDVGGYADYAPSLEFSRLVEGEGLNAVRECGDAKGSWTEQCTLWAEGEAYRFVVNTQGPNYPYPFAELRGEWRVSPSAKGSLVTMDFDATMRGGVVGEVMLAAMAAQFDKSVQGLLDRWEAAMLAGPQELAA